MGMWERLADVVKSYLHDDDVFGRSAPKSGRPAGDPDLDAAYEELNDFLKGEKPGDKNWGRENAGGTGSSGGASDSRFRRPMPEELRKDFEELGLGPDATQAECKEAYKKILKINHPDRHAGNPENMKKATEKTARVNAAYDRLVNWFRAFN